MGRPTNSILLNKLNELILKNINQKENTIIKASFCLRFILKDFHV